MTRLPWAAAGRTVVGLVLLSSGLHKTFAPVEEFAAVIEKYYLLGGEGSIMAAAHFFPFAEILVGLALVLGWRPRWSAAAAMGLFAAFIGAIASTKLRGIPLEDCGCFGKGIHLKPEYTMALDSVLILLSYFAWSRPKDGAWLDSWVDKGT